MFSLVLKRMAAISNVCNHGFIPLSLLGNIVMGIGEKANRMTGPGLEWLIAVPFREISVAYVCIGFVSHTVFYILTSF